MEGAKGNGGGGRDGGPCGEEGRHGDATVGRMHHHARPLSRQQRLAAVSKAAAASHDAAAWTAAVLCQAGRRRRHCCAQRVTEAMACIFALKNIKNIKRACNSVIGLVFYLDYK